MTTALLLVDAQRNMLEGPGAVPAASAVKPALEDLIAQARAAQAVVVHVQNDGPPGDPDQPHTDGWDLVFPPAEGELVVRKDRPDTFDAHPELARILRERGVDRVVVAGMPSRCVRSTLTRRSEP